MENASYGGLRSIAFLTRQECATPTESYTEVQAPSIYVIGSVRARVKLNGELTGTPIDHEQS